MHTWEAVRTELRKLPWKDYKILDIGIGEGMFWRGYGYRGHHNEIDPDWLFYPCNVTGMDMDLYDYTKQGIHFVQGDVRNMPFRDGEFDMCMMIEVLEHMPDNVEKAVSEIRRVCKRWIITTPAYDDPGLHNESGEKLFWSNDWRDNLIEAVPENEVGHHSHYHIYTENELRKLFPDSKISRFHVEDENNDHWLIEKVI